MTVNEAIKKLQEYAEMGYGEKPMLWINLNIQEHVEVEVICPVQDDYQLPDGYGIEVRS